MSARMLVVLGQWSYDAYAPDPMVFDMRRKGRSLGRAAICDWEGCQRGLR